jgi:hypothetical protein
MNYRVWYSTLSFADFVIDNTNLLTRSCSKQKMYESDANNSRNFHSMPDHIKKILYLDAPDIIVELDNEPIFSIEVSTEAGTGHNAFQRFARLAASVENNVPALYIYPEAAIITRKNAPPGWDKINPLVFKALDDVMSIYGIPALLFYFPSDFRTHSTAALAPNILTKGLKFDPNLRYAGSPLGTDPEMLKMFDCINRLIKTVEKYNPVIAREKHLAKRKIINQKATMSAEYVSKGGNLNSSPLTSTIKVPTQYLLNYLSPHQTGGYQIGELLRSRDETIIYKINAKFRGDPYPGALAAIDYLLCREGKTFEEREYNLVLAWGDLQEDTQNSSLKLTTISNKSTINDFIDSVKSSENKNILGKDYNQIANHEIPRYYMQVRYGSTYSKVKHIRVYSYFADAILFPDGALWRDA